MGRQGTRDGVIDPRVFLKFVADLVDGQRRARPQFDGRFTLLDFGLASERENGGRRRRN